MELREKWVSFYGVNQRRITNKCQNCHVSVCAKFSQLCFGQILFELVYSWESYHKNKNGKLFNEIVYSWTASAVSVHYDSRCFAPMTTSMMINCTTFWLLFYFSLLRVILRLWTTVDVHNHLRVVDCFFCLPEIVGVTMSPATTDRSHDMSPTLTTSSSALVMVSQWAYGLLFTSRQRQP